MKPRQSKTVFRNYLSASKSPVQGVEAMLRFYQEVRAEQCSVEHNGDMLLFQWGTYDWGRGAHFEMDITRQFIAGKTTDDGVMSQLSLTFAYTRSPANALFGASNQWCQHPDGVAEFRAAIGRASVFVALADGVPQSMSLRYGLV